MTGSSERLKRLHPVRLPATLLLLAAVAAHGQEPRIEVRHAFTQLIDDVYYLFARVDYELSEEAVDVLRMGVVLTLRLEIEVFHERRFWADDEAAALEQVYKLQFHALSQRYIVQNVNSGDQISVASLKAATRLFGPIEGLPLLDATLLDPDERYEVRMRATLQTGSVPWALRLLGFFWDDSRISSEWYTWALQR